MLFITEGWGVVCAATHHSFAGTAYSSWMGQLVVFCWINHPGGYLKPDSNKDLQIGDRVVLCESNIAMEGAVVALLGEGYVRIRWSDSGVRTTHRCYAVKRGHQAAGWNSVLTLP